MHASVYMYIGSSMNSGIKIILDRNAIATIRYIIYLHVLIGILEMIWISYT
jgi:hypothetical protein